ncbi:MAG: hypothetical protein KDB09_06985 [Acidimicrobiales bacterium]|nr:hypothetical protein [Acidimicrobiales bacterium]
MSAIQRHRFWTAATACLILVVSGCGSDKGSTPPTTTAAPTTTTDEKPTTTVDRTDEKAALKMMPVLAVTGCPGAATPTTVAPDVSGTGPDATTTTEAATGAGSELDGLYPTADGVYCHTVGEPFGDGNDLHDATVAEVNGAFQVMVRVKPESIDKLNAGFNACFTAQPQCPAGPSGTGSVAFVLDGVVLLAPPVTAENLADEVFLVANDLTEREARKLISTLNR